MSYGDAELAIAAGADALGMIFAESPRRIDFAHAVQISRRIGAEIEPVGVFVNPSLDDVRRVQALFPNLTVQLSGGESPAFAASVGAPVIKAVHVRDESEDELEATCARYPGAVALFDTKSGEVYGGTATAFNWRLVERIAKRRHVFVAGGLTPENVGGLVRAVRPYGVDVRSGIETGGRKDLSKMQRFVLAVRESDAA